MGMTRQAKADAVSVLAEKLSKAKGGLIAGFSGLNVASVTQIRRKFREANIEYRVVKNSLMKRVLAGTSREGLSKHFVGPTAIVFKYDDEAGVMGKIAKDLSKDFEALKFKGGFFQDSLISGEGAVETLASLPTMDEARATFIGVLLAPATKLAGVTQAPARELAGVLKAKAEKE